MNNIDRYKMIKDYKKLINEIKRDAEANWTPPTTYKDNKPHLKDFELHNIDIDKLCELYKVFKKEEDKESMYEKMVNFYIGFGLFAFIILGFFYPSLALLLIVGFPIITYIAYKKRRIYKFEYEKEYKKYQEYISASKDFEWWQTRKKRDFWTSLSGRQFEVEICKLFNKNGYEAKLCTQGGDGGIDIDLYKDGIHSVVQCKAHNSKIFPSVARDLFGTMTSKNVKQGYLVTLYGGTAGTIKFCEENNILLWDLSIILKNM